jgi:hypothetical protein
MKIWKEAVLAKSKYYPGIYLKGMRKITKIVNQDSVFPAQNSSREPSEWETVVPACSVSCIEEMRSACKVLIGKSEE